jgi:hypothetical protein
VDVLEAVRTLGNDARRPNVISRAIEIGGWDAKELEARAWYTGTGAQSHIENIVGKALEREEGLTLRLRQLHGIYALTAPSSAGGFGTAYRRAGDKEPAQDELSAHLADLAELERATKRHMDLQDLLADQLRAQGVEPRSPGTWQPQFDLAFEHGDEYFVVEVKTTDPVSSQQVRLGAGQVLEYCHLLRDTVDCDVRPVLLVEAELPSPWETLIDELGIRIIRADCLSESLSALLLPA